MDLFGMKFCVALGAWRLRFVLMLEDAEAAPERAPRMHGSQIAVYRDPHGVRLN